MNGQVAATPDVALAFAVAPLAAGKRACFAARSSGLARSDDDGATWRSLSGALGAVDTITAVAVSPAVADDHTLFAGTAGGILRSTDLGESWQAVPFGSPPPLVSALTVSPAFREDGIVLAGTLEDGLFRSTDRGASWRPANPGLLDMAVLAIAISPTFAADQTVLLGTSTGLYLSTTGGRSWRDLDGPEAAPVVAIAISPRFAQDRLLFAGTEGAGLFASRDGGETWRPLAEDLSSPDIVRIQVWSGPAETTGVLVVTADEVAVSRSGGAEWTASELELASGATIVSATPLDEGDEAAGLLVGLASGAIRRLDIR